MPPVTASLDSTVVTFVVDRGVLARFNLISCLDQGLIQEEETE